jgi:hypothetical protein
MVDSPAIPSTARMIDYWLGGEHHYPADVAAAGAFESAYGQCATEFRDLRRFLGRAVRAIHQHGIDNYLVFGAGVPTCGNVHEVIPGAHVLYTDIDEVNVALGQRILAGSAHVAYTHGDATKVSTIDPQVLTDVLPAWGRGPVGVVFLGLAAFLDDETLAAAFDALYKATLRGSWLAFDFDSQELAAYPEALAMMGPAFHMRDPLSFPALLGRWRLTGEGVAPASAWGLTAVSDRTPVAFYGGLATR